jgi:hypothetical protein
VKFRLRGGARRCLRSCSGMCQSWTSGNEVTDTQLCLSIGLPTLAVVLGMILNGFLFNALSARMTSLESRTGGVESGLAARMRSLENVLSARMNSLESRMVSLQEQMHLMIGKIGELDTRVSILGDRSNRS